MKRGICSRDHEDFRASMRGLLDRSVMPNLARFAEARAFPREMWLEAGEQGLRGLRERSTDFRVKDPMDSAKKSLEPSERHRKLPVGPAGDAR